MQPFSRAIMTDSGSRLFMKAQAGEAKIKFTKIAVGDGEYSGEERKISSQQIKTELKSLKNSYPISKIEVVSDHSVKVTALITNYDPISEEAVVENGYYINEMGLFAKESEDEDGETEVLYSIAIVEGETGDFMPPFDGNNPAQIIQEYYATVNNAEEVTIEMGKGAVALAEDLEKIMILDFDDSGEVEGVESFEDFMASFVKDTNIYQFFSNLKAGLKYILHTGKLVNSGMCETPGEFALDAAFGKTLQDQITGLYSEITPVVRTKDDGILTYLVSGLEYTNAIFVRYGSIVCAHLHGTCPYKLGENIYAKITDPVFIPSREITVVAAFASGTAKNGTGILKIKQDGSVNIIATEEGLNWIFADVFYTV